MKISASIGPPYYFSEYFGTKIMNEKNIWGEKNSNRVLNKYCWYVLYPGKLTRHKIITIHIHVKSRNQNNWHTGDLTSGLLKMIGYYLGWGARAEGTVRRRKNWRLKITFTNETTCNSYKTHILKLNLKISCENWIQHIIQSSPTSNTYISFLLK